MLHLSQAYRLLSVKEAYAYGQPGLIIEPCEIHGFGILLLTTCQIKVTLFKNWQTNLDHGCQYGIKPPPPLHYQNKNKDLKWGHMYAPLKCLTCPILSLLHLLFGGIRTSTTQVRKGLGVNIRVKYWNFCAGHFKSLLILVVWWGGGLPYWHPWFGCKLSTG